jgi:hypothetical protein
MSDWGYFPSVTRFGEDDATGGSTYKTQVLAGGSAHTKGSWYQLAASTPFAFDWIEVHIQTSSGSQTALVDIGIGGAGSEVVLIPNLLIESQSAYLYHVNYRLPIAVPAGSRISARCQSNLGSADFYVKTHFAATNGAIPAQRAISYGANLTNSRGTLVQASISANTFASWVEITPSCDEMRYAVFCIQSDQNNGDQDVALNIGVGGAGAEQIVFPSHYMECADATLSGAIPGELTIPLCLPAGTRIACEAKSSAGGMNVDVVLIGLL